MREKRLHQRRSSSNWRHAGPLCRSRPGGPDGVLDPNAGSTQTRGCPLYASNLIRAHKNPFTVADADTTYRQNSYRQQHRQSGLQPGGLPIAVDLRHRPGDVRLARSHPRVINSRFDHVDSLANAFRASYLDTLDALSNLIEQLTVPVTVVGVGSQASLDGVSKSADRVKPATTRFVRAVLNRSSSIGVRGASRPATI